jgi:hypothetical protein
MSSSSCSVPVSLGELFDKYSILEIKHERVKDENKKQCVKTEMECLKPYIECYNLPKELMDELKYVNEKLWDIEDNIRIKEHKSEFDDEFISLARSVYITNDHRALIKTKINKLLNSHIIEIKSYC